MKVWSVEYEYRTRPWFRKGRIRRERVAFSAESLTQLYELARDEGERRFARRTWLIANIECVEAEREALVPSSFEKKGAA